METLKGIAMGIGAALCVALFFCLLFVIWKYKWIIISVLFCITFPVVLAMEGYKKARGAYPAWYSKIMDEEEK